MFYSITYTRTNLRNTKMGDSKAGGTKDIDISNFSKTGDTDKILGYISSVSFTRYHTKTKTSASHSIIMRSYLINKDGESVVSNDNIWDGWNSSGAITRTDTFTNVLTSIISTLQTIRIEWDANSYSGDLYYRATETNPQILTINFFQPGASYYDTEWKNCLVHYFDGEEWKLCSLKYYDGTNWVSLK